MRHKVCRILNDVDSIVQQTIWHKSTLHSIISKYFLGGTVSHFGKKTFLDRHLCYFCGHCLFQLIFVGLLLVIDLVLHNDVNFQNSRSRILHTQLSDFLLIWNPAIRNFIINENEIFMISTLDFLKKMLIS